MAIFIVSPSGGDINQGTTYVGGIVPSDSDIIGFNSSSGTLNVTLVGAIGRVAGIDFTNCISTVNFTAPLALENTTTNTISINLGTGGYTLTGTPSINIYNVNSGTTVTLTSNGIHWTGSLSLGLHITNHSIILSDDWNQDGELLINGIGTTLNFLNNTFNINGICTGDINGDLQIGENSTSIINFNGNVTLNDISFDGKELKYSGGTLTFINLLISNNILYDTILDLNGLVADVVSITTNNPLLNIILNSTLNVTNLYVNATTSFYRVAFGGSYGFNASNFIINYFTPPEVELKSAIQYYVNDSIDIESARIMSSTPGSKALLTLSLSTDQKAVVNILATDIDSSNGKRVNNFYGTATNCDNWRIWNDNTLPQVCSTF